MEQQRVIAFQMDLFQSLEKDALCPSHNRDIVSGAEARKALQVEGAGEQGRALARNLMQVVFSPDNIKRAYKRVKQNKGAAGIDGMVTGGFADWFREEGENLLKELQSGRYQPQAVKLAEIRKPNGGMRKLGIPTVTDRIIQQAVAQVLSLLYERQFFREQLWFPPQPKCPYGIKEGKRLRGIGKNNRSRHGLGELLRRSTS